MSESSVKRLCFVHVPKCGGTSLNEAFKKSIGIGPLSLKGTKIDAAATLKEARRKNIHPLVLREQKLISKLSKKRYKYVKGHFRCTSEVRQKFEKDWIFMTILRDPVRRWISQYFFNLHKKHDHTKHSMNLDDYLQSEVGMNSGAIYVDFFTDGSDLSGDQGINQAMENLRSFPLVGILENMDPFKNDFEKVVGAKLQTIRNRNINPLPKDQMEKQISDDQMKKIREVCKPDLQIYNHFLGKLN